jgi:2-phospho-L-lactate guanylyltransferase
MRAYARPVVAIPIESRSAVVIPVKGFSNAKKRLTGFVSRNGREELARRMASRVVAAADGLPTFVVSDDDEVARWAVLQGARVVRDNGHSLNDAVAAGVREARDAGTGTAIIVHADIPFVASLQRFANTETGSALIVPNTAYDGTNILVIPTHVEFRFQYGKGSFIRHHRELLRLGLRVVVAPDYSFAADVDFPQDLVTARLAGVFP